MNHPAYIKVKVGPLTIGKGHPAVIQSMCNTDTNDIDASVAQCMRIFDAGAQMVRLTTQGMREVESLSAIKEKLRSKGYHQPLVADVHFLPKVALAAAAVAEKVRINPGNYVERKYNGPERFDAGEQERQTEGIRKNLLPLIDVCRKHGTAIRVGVNHGSLSKRILSWYGNTPEGMVESALEFIRIFREENFDNLVISLKSSDSRVMMQANRLMYKKMLEDGNVYPLHLGVTEAGADEDGRIKSATGICSLLADGIGDTIRVSLTEDPEFEIPVAKTMARLFDRQENDPDRLSDPDLGFDPFSYRKRKSNSRGIIGGDKPAVVITGSSRSFLDEILLKEGGYTINEDDTLSIADQAADFLCFTETSEELPSEHGLWIVTPPTATGGLRHGAELHPVLRAGENKPAENLPCLIVFPADASQETIQNAMIGERDILVVSLPGKNAIHEGRAFFKKLSDAGILNPVILHKKYSSQHREETMIRASGEIGSLLMDGFGDGVWLEDEGTPEENAFLRELSFNILQATGTRISKTEYIACPSCGRTLFNIQDTLRKVKEATAGMKGLKIAVMGCIVNGPGEMADADYGYVGAGRGKVSLYKGKEVYRRNIPEEEAIEALVELIRRRTTDDVPQTTDGKDDGP